MANGAYNIIKKAMEQANFDWGASSWKAVLVGTGYTPNFSTDTVIGDLGANVIGSAVTLAGNAVSSAAIVSANSATFTGVSSGLTVKAVVVYFDNGSLTRLAFYYDTGSGFPYTTTGSNITVDWNNTPTAGNLMQLV